MAEKPDPRVAPETPKSEPEKKVENCGPKNRHDLGMDVANDVAGQEESDEARNEALKAAGIDISNRDIAHIDALTIIRSLKEMRKLGLNDNEALHLLEFTKKEKIDELIGYIEKAKKLNIYPHTAGIFFLDNVPFADLKLIADIGIKSSKDICTVVYGLAKNYDGGNVKAMVDVMKLLNVMTESELQELQMVLFRCKLEDVIKKVGEMKSRGVSGGFINGLYETMSVENDDYFLLKNFLKSRDDTIDLYRSGLAAKEMLDIAKKLEARGVKDIFKFIRKIIDVVNENGGGDFMSFYRIAIKLKINSHEGLLKLGNYKEHFHLKDIDVNRNVDKLVSSGIEIEEEYIDILVFLATPLVDNNLLKIAVSFRKNHPRAFYRFQGEDGINLAKWYAEQSKEMQDFMDAVIGRHFSINYDNLVPGFVSDPSLPICIEVYKNMEKRDVEEALRFGRTLYYQGVKTLPDKVTLAQKLEKYREVQSKADKIKIFEGRNIIFLANGERDSGGKPTFYSEETLNDFKKSKGPNGKQSFHAPSSDKPTFEDLQNIKNETLKEIENMSPPMTFFFEGHGGPEELYISRGQLVLSTPQGKAAINTISFKELAAAITKRKNKFPKDALSKDIYINSGCFNHTFIRNLYAEIKSLGGILPITIGESEYGQLGFGGSEEKYKSIYKLGTLGTTIGDIRMNESKYLLSNFTVYVPDEQGNPVQVVKGEEGQGGKTG